MKFRWFLGVAIPVCLLGSTPVKTVQKQELPMPDCRRALYALYQQEDRFSFEIPLVVIAADDLYAWSSLDPAGCPAGPLSANVTSDAPRLQSLSMKRIWLGASRSLEANSARVPGSPQRLEAHNLTVRAMHGYAALPELIPSDHPDALALLTQLDSALSLDPDLPTTYWLKARIEAELSRSEQSIADFRRALILPNHPLDTSLSLAMSLSDRGERQEALYIFEDLIAEIRERVDVPDLSQVTITQDVALAFKPGDAFSTLAAAHLGRGDIHQAYGRCDLAKPDYEIACKLGLPAGCERSCQD